MLDKNFITLNPTIKCSSFFLFILFMSSVVFSQESKLDTVKRNNSYGIWLLPSAKDNIYGIAIGLFGSEIICDKKNVKHSHGLNIQLLGQGFFIPINKNAFSYKALFSTDSSYMVSIMDSSNTKAVHNGILISGFGTMTEISNGLVFSPWFSMGKKVNGLAFNLFANKYTVSNGVSIAFSNESYKTNGVQIGIVNRTRKLKGFQFGLWNVNNKRKLPILNWCFKST